MFWGYTNLSRYLGAEQPVYALKSRGLEGRKEFDRIEEMAAAYVNELRAFQRRGGYVTSLSMTFWPSISPSEPERAWRHRALANGSGSKPKRRRPTPSGNADNTTSTRTLTKNLVAKLGVR